jgi:hypothetical protein
MRTVLVLDTSGDIVNHLRRSMRPKAYRLVKASTLGEALSILEGVTIDLILADVHASDAETAKKTLHSLCRAGRRGSLVALAGCDTGEFDHLQPDGLVAVMRKNPKLTGLAESLEAILANHCIASSMPSHSIGFDPRLRSDFVVF